MSVFQEVTLGWGDKEYVIPADRVLGAIAIVEDVITFPELITSLSSGRPPFAKLSKAYGSVLRYAGARITDDQVYEGMFTAGSVQEQIVKSVNALMVMMTPPSAMAKADEDQNPGNLKARAQKPSKRSSRQQSAAVG